MVYLHSKCWTPVLLFKLFSGRTFRLRVCICLRATLIDVRRVRPIFIDPRVAFLQAETHDTFAKLHSGVRAADLQSWRAPLAKRISHISVASPAGESEFGTKFGSRFYHPFGSGGALCVCVAVAHALIKLLPRCQ
jgi:hypothetical protein